MLFTISILGFNRADCTQRCLQSIEKHSKDVDFEVIFVNNGSTDDTESVFLHSNIENKLYIPLGVNTGFPAGHNLALNFANGDFFLVLNNDIVIEEDGWLDKLAQPLEDPEVALVGLSNTCCSLKENGNGFIGERLEYIEGSCLMGRTEFFREFGLFNESYKMFFFEDSDLSLRVRQAGFKIATVPIKNQHMRASSHRGVDRDFMKKNVEENRKVFLKKWSRYLHTRKFVNSVLIKMFSHGGGDLVCMSPIIDGVRKDHPYAKIELETNWPDLFKNNPALDGVFGRRNQYAHSYDRIIDIELDYSTYSLIADDAAEVAGVTIKNKTPKLFLDPLELQAASNYLQVVRDEESLLIGCNLLIERHKWQGKNWNIEYATELVDKLRRAGFKIVELGKNVKSTGLADMDLVGKTSIRELIAIVANLDAFIGVDSMIFHIAQAFEIPSFILFGATEPVSLVVNFDKTIVIRDDNLPCIGCYQRKGKSNYNKCIMNNESCMLNITPELVYSYVTGETDGISSNIKYLQKRIRGEKC